MKVITIDLHTHLNEKNVRPEDYWKRVQEIKLDAVAITEHNCFNPKDAFEKLNKTKPENVLLIPGMELFTSLGHAIVYAKDASIYKEIEFLETKVDIERVLEIVKEKKFYLSFAHPFGYDHDSVCFLAGTSAAKKLITKHQTGVEIYNGLVSQLSNFLYDSKWITKPFNFLSFIEKNFVSKKIGLSRAGVKIKNSFDSRRQEILMRCIKAIELGKEAGFVTAGSDAHSAERIGTGIMKIRFEKELTAENVLEALKEKENILWSGPLIQEKNGAYEKVDSNLKGKEIAQGIKYITSRAVKRGRQRIPTEKIKTRIKNLGEGKITKKIKNMKIREKINGIKLNEKIKGSRIAKRIGETGIAKRINKMGKKKESERK